VLAESHDANAIVKAVTDYVARRMVEREHALAAPSAVAEVPRNERRRWRGFWLFVLGFVIGALALFGSALYASLTNF
jgi:hypothetical protein